MAWVFLLVCSPVASDLEALVCTAAPPPPPPPAEDAVNPQTAQLLCVYREKEEAMLVLC